MRKCILFFFFGSLAATLQAQNVGIGTSFPKALLHVADGNVLFSGPITVPIATGAYPPAQGPGARMMWYPQKAAFRVGYTYGDTWDFSKIGNYSFAAGYGTTASGYISTALGNGSVALGDFSSAFGLGLLAKTTAEINVGAYNTDYTPTYTAGWFATDRLFVIGNGVGPNSRSDALVILKNGNTGIGTSTPTEKLEVAGKIKTSSLQITDGTANGSILTSDGSGNASWATPISSPVYWTASGNHIYNNNTGNTGVGVAAPTSKLSVSVNGDEVGGTAANSVLRVNGGRLSVNQIPTDANSEISLAHFGFQSGLQNNVGLAIRAQRFYGGNFWETTAITIGYDVDNTIRAGNAFIAIAGTGNVGVGIINPLNKLSVAGSADFTGNVGIGTATPTNKLDVVAPGSSIRSLSGSIGLNTSFQVGRIGAEGTLAIAAGAGQFANDAIAGDIILRAETSGQKLIFNTGSGNATLVVFNGKVGIGTISPTTKLDVSGIVNASGGFTQASDVRFKRDVTILPNSLNNLLQLRGTQYYFKQDDFPEMSFSSEKQIGVIAQEVEQVFPELITTGKDGYKSVNYIGLIPVLIESIKEQQQQIEALKKENAAIKKMIESGR